jgi:hypothetical protein
VAPLKMRLIEADAHPSATEASVASAALSMALRWQCDVRVRCGVRSYVIRSRDAQMAAQVLAEREVETPAPPAEAAVRPSPSEQSL